MRCPDCGFENPEYTAVCELCGRSLEMSDASIFDEEPLFRTPVKKTKKNRRMLIGAIIAGVIVFVAIIVTLILVFGNRPLASEPEPEPIEQVQTPVEKPDPEPEEPETETVDYTLYIGAWETGTQSAGGTWLNIKSAEKDTITFDISVIAAAEEEGKTASLTEVSAICSGRTAAFTFTDDGWGNSGNGTLIFGTEQIGVNILITASAGRGWGLQTDCIVKRPSVQVTHEDIVIPTVEGVVSPAVKIEPKLGTVKAEGGLNLRKSPAQNGEKLVLLPNQAEVTVYGTNEDGEWLYIQYGGYVGWASGSYITVSASLNQLTSDTVISVFRPLLLAYASSQNGFYGAKADTSQMYSFEGIDPSLACYKVTNASSVEQIDTLLRGCLADDIVDGYNISEHFTVRDSSLYVLVMPRGGTMYDGASVRIEKTVDDIYYISADCYGEEGLYTSTAVFTVKKLNGRYKITGTDSTYQKSGMTTSAATDAISW